MIWEERDFDPLFDSARDPGEPPELEEDDYARSLFDATTGEFFDA